MYHCQLTIYLLGQGEAYFPVFRTMTPLEHFAHSFFESGKVEEKQFSEADVLIVDAPTVNLEETLELVKAQQNSKTKIIMMAEKEQIPLFSEAMSRFTDLWTLPMTEEEARFHFYRFQQMCKQETDAWQTGQYLETTINSTPNMIWFKSKEGLHEKVNDSFCRTVRKTKEQVEGRDHYYIWDVNPDDPENEGLDCMASDNEVMRKQKICAGEELVKSGEETKLLMTYKAPLYDLDGTVMGTTGIGLDITKERAYEQEIIHKNQTLEKLFENLDCGVIYHSADKADILSINRAALEILGYDSEEELMAAGFDMIAPSVLDKEKLRKSIGTLQKPGDSVEVEYRVQHKNGEIVHVLGNIKLFQENGKLCYRRFLLNVTAQKQKENEERRYQMELVQALSLDYNLVFYFDLDTEEGMVIRASQEGSSLFAPSFSEHVMLRESMERYIGQFVCEEDREKMKKACSGENLKSELDKREFYYVSYRALIEGEIKYYEMKVVHTGLWDSKHSIVLGFRSVDEEKRIEQEQKMLLEDALCQADKANRAKSMFLSNMSHDIRTPMNAVMGFTTLAKEHVDEPQQVDKYLDRIISSGNHMLEIINDVLDMSRIESGKMQLEEAPCRLSDILTGLTSMLQANVREKQLEFALETKNVTHEDIICDKTRLNQILLNILSNSIKYTNPGGTIHMLVTEKGSMRKGYTNFEFCIKDNGIGMSEEFLSRIYEPFEREKNTTVSGIQGTGLGMPIVKNIVNMMEGTIDIKSEPGQGTEVTIDFLFRTQTESEKEQEILEQQKNGPLSESSPVMGGRILLVEDNELNQEIATEILDNAGFEVEVAANGSIAVDMLRDSEPGYYDVVLMDVQMPVMNGYEATKEIRRLSSPKLASIPIFAMTANAFEEDKREALKSGMNGHIAKPIDVKKLMEALREVLG